MKKSRIFLSLAAMILAIAGAAAAKMARFGSSIGYFNNSDGTCLPIISQCNKSNQVVEPICRTTLIDNNKHAYRTIIYTNVHCLQPMHYDMQ